MNKIILVAILTMGFTAPAMAVSKGDSANPNFIVETAPLTNRSADDILADPVASTAAVNAVTASSSTATRVDSAFNAKALAALGSDYQRAEITIQNKDTESVYCGYSPSETNSTESYEIPAGDVWNFELGKNTAVYCIAAAGSTANLRVGGIAWKR